VLSVKVYCKIDPWRDLGRKDANIVSEKNEKKKFGILNREKKKTFSVIKGTLFVRVNFINI